MRNNWIFITALVLFIVVVSNYVTMAQESARSSNSENEIGYKVSQVLSKMTLEEEIGQMNQYNGFWDATGPVPKEGHASQKFEHLNSGLIG